MSAPGLWGQELARLTIKHDPHRIVPRTNALTLAHKNTRLGCGGSLTLDAGPAKGGAGIATAETLTPAAAPDPFT
jgi:hypothetical protein